MKENQVEKEVIVEEAEKESICWALLELQSVKK